MICLRADLVQAYETLGDEITAAKQRAAKADSLAAAAPDLPEMEGRLREAEEEMREATVPFVLRALPRPRFRALVSEHPPRKGEDGNPVSQDWNGVNHSTYYSALIRECTVTPELDDETWRLLLDEKLSDRQYEDLSEAAFDISRDKIDYPFMYGAFQPKPNFAAALSKPRG